MANIPGPAVASSTTVSSSAPSPKLPGWARASVALGVLLAVVALLAALDVELESRRHRMLAGKVMHATIGWPHAFATLTARNLEQGAPPGTIDWFWFSTDCTLLGLIFLVVLVLSVGGWVAIWRFAHAIAAQRRWQAIFAGLSSALLWYAVAILSFPPTDAGSQLLTAPAEVQVVVGNWFTTEAGPHILPAGLATHVADVAVILLAIILPGMVLSLPALWLARLWPENKDEKTTSQ